MPADFGRRFDELLKQAEAIEASKKATPSQYGVQTYVDQVTLLNWSVKARHLINSVCGADSQHFIVFLAKSPSPIRRTTSYFRR
jgi:hypothetical protein